MQDNVCFLLFPTFLYSSASCVKEKKVKHDLWRCNTIQVDAAYSTIIMYGQATITIVIITTTIETLLYYTYNWRGVYV